MQQRTVPFVAVVGGLWALDEPMRSAAKETAREIGAELAKAGFGLVVYYSHEDALEPHVVAGYVANARGSKLIRIRYSQAQVGAIRFAEETSHAELFERELFPETSWEAPFYRSMAESEGVDAVLLLAGGNSTFIAGQIAIARGLPILAVDTFGGSAGQIWTQLAHRGGRDSKSWTSQGAAPFVAALRQQCAAASNMRREAVQREARLAQIESRRGRSLYLGGSLAALLLMLALAFSDPMPVPHALVVFGGLVAAGATGAVVRGLLGAGGESDLFVSLMLGAVAGIIVGLAYLIPQWMGAPEVLATGHSGVTPRDRIQFASALLVALSAGVGFDTVLGRVRQSAETTSITAAP